MIVKQKEPAPKPSDPRRRAGHEAEDQMAFYLNRAFASDDALFVLNDLRIVDPEQPEHNGSPGICQIDHLIVHRWGVFIIESKSAIESVTIQADGSGGDEWTRQFGGRDQSMKSPIQQARLQAELMRNFLQRHREQLLGRMPLGLRTFSKITMGTDQRGFGKMPFQIIVAISDGGHIKRIGDWREPEGPFGTFVCKADHATDKVRNEYAKHKSSAPVLTKDIGMYGQWSMEREEAGRVAGFLAEHHTPPRSIPRQAPPVTTPSPTISQISTTPTAPDSPKPTGVPGAACKSCQGVRLTARSGRYGYYWRCQDCSANTAMPTTCSACGTTGTRGKGVRIQKDGPNYFRSCETCESRERIWLEPAST